MRLPGGRTLRILLDRVLPPAPLPTPPPPPAVPQRPGEGRFETGLPTAQRVIDLWAGNWASDLSGLLDVTGTGVAKLFEGDPRPALAARALGRDGRLDGFSVLELGPLEAGHSWHLQRLGAGPILAIEASAEHYLKCLALKEWIDLSATRFLYGDFTAWMEEKAQRFDLVFCSGVLYHMPDPLRLIAAVAAASDRCFVWTHFHAPEVRPAPLAPRHAERDGFATTYWGFDYGEKAAGFWGGNHAGTNWMTREAIIGAFAHFGLTEHEVLQENLDHPAGACFSVAFRRPG